MIAAFGFGSSSTSSTAPSSKPSHGQCRHIPGRRHKL
jgi:hypothetical protein